MMALLAAPHSCAVFDHTHECHPSAPLAPTPEVLKWIVCLSCLRSAGAAGVEYVKPAQLATDSHTRKALPSVIGAQPPGQASSRSLPAGRKPAVCAKGGGTPPAHGSAGWYSHVRL